MAKRKPSPRAPVIPRPVPIAWGCAYPDHSHESEAKARACIKRTLAVGSCPVCGAACQIHCRDMRGEGNDTCVNGHVYRTKDAVMIGPR